MKNEVKVYQHGEYNLPTVLNKENEPWFFASEACKSLEITNTSRALLLLDKEDVTDIVLNNPGYKGKRGQNKRIKVKAITLPGLFDLILSSRKKTVRPFKRWVTHVVLPEIAKEGSYNIEREGQKNPYKRLASDIFYKSYNRDHAKQELSKAINLVNKAMMGMSSKECKEKHGMRPRDWIRKNKPELLEEYSRLQKFLIVEIERGRELLQIKTTLRSMGYK